MSVATRQPPPAAAAAAPIEPRKAKRVARGRDEIEARIDLHGMRQVRGARRAAGVSASSPSQRLPNGAGDHRQGSRVGDVDSHAPFDMFQDRDRGVLRRNVPRWLAEPDLRMIVVGYTSAHVRHGGDGAFYVQLRNAEKFRG